MQHSPAETDIVERITFKKFSVSYVFNGIFQGILRLQDIVIKKALLANDFVITILSMVWPASNFFSTYFGGLMAGRNKKKFLITAGIFGRLSLLLVFFIKTPWELIGLLFLVYSANSIILPAQNSIIQSNIRWSKTGKIFGYLFSLLSIFIVLSAYITGKLLDLNGNFWRIAFSVAGISGFLHVIILSSIKQHKYSKTKKAIGLKELLKPFAQTYELLKKDKAFAIFQIFYFIYGTAFLMILPALPRLLVVELGLSYTIISISRVFMSQTGRIILSPFIGKIFDRISPVKFTAYSFFVLSLYALSLGLVVILPQNFKLPFVFLAFFIFSIGMTGVNFSWTLSSIHFAGENDASRYQGVHVTLTSIRGISAPFLGYFIMKIFPLQYVFFTAMLLFLIAAVGMCKKVPLDNFVYLTKNQYK